MNKLSDYDFNLPDELIAIHPAEPRDSSRLLVLDKKTGKIKHKHFYDIVDYLKAGDVLVLNNSKVIPARLLAHKKETGGKIEVLLHKKLDKNIWQCLVGGKVKEGLELIFTLTHPGRAARTPLSRGELSALVLKNNHDGTWDLRFNKSGAALMKAIERIGEVPLPPYIVKQRNICLCDRGESEVKQIRSNTPRPIGHPSQEGNDKVDYQTVFADAKKAGSVAAPTAGLHFTPELLKKIKKKGVKILEISLFVGMGTFAPVKVEDFTKHKMHAEWVEISKSAIINLQSAIKNKQRVIAVGTTSARSLEACWNNFVNTPHPIGRPSREGKSPQPGADVPLLSRGGSSASRILAGAFAKGSFKSWVDIFIYPGYEFKIVDAMITNFHLPKSTLLMLVSALAEKKNIDQAYREAIKNKYHFYSYGDAMFIK
jgi:S-adenosylmethionine:tRNA ribosyltransferase-isomerase